MPPILNPLKRLLERRFRTSNSEKLYGAIVAQARLPEFYRALRIPDSLEGRFGLLALNLFIVLHALSGREGGAPLAQSLTDRFTEDMETVLREQGMSDMAVPKTMRALAGSAHGILQHYEDALTQGEAPLATAIEASLPMAAETRGVSSKALASYVMASVGATSRQALAGLKAGKVDFAELGQ